MLHVLLKSNIQHPSFSENRVSKALEPPPPPASYLYEALADVAGTEGLVAARAHRQSREEEEESCGGGGGEDQLTGPHPDGSPARHWKHLHQQQQHTSTGPQRAGSTNNKRSELRMNTRLPMWRIQSVPGNHRAAKRGRKRPKVTWSISNFDLNDEIICFSLSSSAF